MELQRYASILIRQSNELLKLTGNHDSGSDNTKAIREQITNMKETLLNLAAQLPVEKVGRHDLYIDL